jgi:coniferyl-aldehyde dehydrogenase
MTFIEREQQAGSDASAIAQLRHVFALQKKAFLEQPMPTLEQRLELLGALAYLMLVNRLKIQAAIAEDFSSHPRQFSDLVECLGVAGRAQYVAEHLAGWMQAQERSADPALYGSGRACVLAQPKGVVGNMAPWNFPFDIGIGPVVEMLAAGNKVIIKPSDLTPACSELTLEMISSTLDHLMYTGSTEVGRSIAVAAAQNLVPVTLELGGKCPALIADDGLSARTIEQVIGCKTIKNGQMCVTVDYALVPHTQRDQFVAMVREHMQANLPDYSQRHDTTGIINQRHLQRLQSYLDDAVAKGATLVQLDGEMGEHSRRMPLTLVLDANDDMLLMQHEIFGPILPIKTYENIAEAVDYINAGERPLGIYVFTETPAVAEQVLARTVSGGACVNAAALHAAMPCLPFGGVGKSGSGRHHGHEGFLEFSNLRSIFYRGENDLVAAMFAPYGELADAVIAGALGQA